MADSSEAGDLTGRRYCENCAASFDPASSHCPECGAAWVYRPPATRRELAWTLSFLSAEHARGAIPDDVFQALRAEWEGRLAPLQVRRRGAPRPEPVRHAPAAGGQVRMPPPPRPGAVPVAAPPQAFAIAHPAPAGPAGAARPVLPRPVAAAPPVIVERPPVYGPPKPPPPPLTQTLSAWAAKRQADILLYLGAFLLSISALIFVAYQGTALNGPLRFAVLAVYTFGFLGLGLTLNRWERVQEAGPVFLGVGALLVPVDFIALRVQVFDQGGVSPEFMWLFGSSTSGGLYLLLAWKGYGRYYVAPAVPAVLIAWGSLAAVLTIDFDWSGAWYELLALPLYVGFVARAWRPAKWIRLGALIVAGAALALSHMITVSEFAFGDLNRGPLPATYAVLVAGMAGALYRERTVFRAAAATTVASPLALTTAWATLHVGVEWWGSFAAVAAAGYLIAAHFDRPERARAWGGAALLAGGVTILATHGAQAGAGGARGALPIAWFLVSAGCAAVFLRWRWAWREAPGIMPAAFAIACLSTFWAAFGLSPAWWGPFAIIAGFGYLAVAHFDEDRLARAWGIAAAAAGTVALVATQLGQVEGGNPWPVPTSYALVSAGAAIAFWRWRWAWREAAAILPVSLALTALTLSWAAIGLSVEWWAPFAAMAGLGYLVLAHFDTPRLARGWGLAAGLCGAVAIAGAHAAVVESVGASRWPVPVSYAIVSAGAAAAFARWRWAWREAAALIPAGLAATALTGCWAGFGMGYLWWGVFAALAGWGYLVIAHFDEERLCRRWGAAAFAMGLVAVAWSQTTQVPLIDQRWPLPATYGLVTVGAIAAFVRWRWAWREAPALVPAGLALTALTVCWAGFGMTAIWWGVFASFAGAGYLVIAHFDEARLARRWGAAALAMGCLAVGWSQATQFGGVAQRWPLPATYGVVGMAATAAFARWRWAWREAAGAIPAALTLTVLTATWAEFDIQPEWWGLYFAGGAAGYLGLAHFDSRPWQGYWRYPAVAGLLLGISVTQSQVGYLGGEHAALPCVYALAFAIAAAAFARWRFDWRTAPAALPALAAATGVSFGWATETVPLSSTGLWVSAAALGYLAMAEADLPRRWEWRMTALLFGGFGIVWQHGAVGRPGSPWKLPVAYGIGLAGATWDAARRRDPGVFIAPIVAGVGGATALWAAGVGSESWCFPGLGVAAGLIAAAKYWPKHAAVQRFGWTYALVAAIAPTVAFVPIHYSSAEQGLAAQLTTATLVALIAVCARGAVARLFGPPEEGARRAERATLFLISFGFLFVAAASANLLAGLKDGDRAWIFAAIGALAWAGLAVTGRRWPGQFGVLAPSATNAFVIAGLMAYVAPATGTAVFAAGAAGPALAFPAARRWSLWVIAQVFAVHAVWMFWEWRDLDLALLPLAYGGLAAVLWFGLARLRHRAGAVTSDAAISFLSWAPWLLSSGLAAVLLSARSADLAPGEPLVRTREWASAAVILAAASSAIAAEGWRLRRRPVWLPATIGLLIALLMGIATREPENVQAYTVPIGLYVVVLSFTWRSTPPLFGRQMAMHEGLMVAGVLTLVLPPANQSFGPGGANYGFELIGLALAFLAAGLVLHARWMVPSGVLTLSGIAVRWLTGGFIEVPFWLVLGVLGTLLLGIGMLVLLQRERWDRAKDRIARWWIEAPPVAG